MRQADPLSTWSVALACALLSPALGCAGARQVGRTAEGFPIDEITLRLSNVYVIEARRPILVDAGTVGDLADLHHALEEERIFPSRVALVILTHGHADHAGLAADLRDESGAAIWLGAGDLPLAHEGTDDVLVPTSVTALLLKPFITSVYRGFEPDRAIDAPTSLLPYGVDGEVFPMPGHTKGSLVVLLGNHSAFVGDMMMGGLGGYFDPRTPREHFYQADRAQNRRNILALVRRGVTTFYLGHGGPVSREDVIKAFDLPSP